MIVTKIKLQYVHAFKKEKIKEKLLEFTARTTIYRTDYASRNVCMLPSSRVESLPTKWDGELFLKAPWRVLISTVVVEDKDDLADLMASRLLDAGIGAEVVTGGYLRTRMSTVSHCSKRPLMCDVQRSGKTTEEPWIKLSMLRVSSSLVTTFLIQSAGKRSAEVACLNFPPVIRPLWTQ